jgi:hypothetical protein
MALPVGPGIDKARKALSALERDALMRRRSADSIRASGHEHGPHQQAAYMNAPDLRCPLLIKDLAPQGPSIHEAFDEAVLRGTARCDIGGPCADGSDPVPVRPWQRTRGRSTSGRWLDGFGAARGAMLSVARYSWAVMAGRQISRVMVFEASFRRWTDHDQATCYSR